MLRYPIIALHQPALSNNMLSVWYAVTDLPSQWLTPLGSHVTLLLFK